MLDGFTENLPERISAGFTDISNAVVAIMLDTDEKYAEPAAQKKSGAPLPPA